MNAALERLRALWEQIELRPRPWLFAVLALGLLFRAALFALEGVSGEEPRSLDVARSVAQGQGFHFCNQYFPFCGPGNDATAQIGPVPALLFAAVLRALGEPAALTAIVVLQMGLGLLTTWMSYALARQLFGSARAGVLAALLCASYPHLARLELYPREETLFAAALAAAMLALVAGLRGGDLRLGALAGASFGAASLSRFALVYFPPLLAVCLPLLAPGSLRRRAGFALAFALAFAAVLAPWALRNQRAFDAFVPGGTLTGYNLYRHNHIVAGDDYLRYVQGEEGERAIRELVARRTDLRGDENEAEMDRVYREEAGAILRAQPLRYATLSAYRLAVLFTDLGVNPTGLPLFWWIVGAENLLLVALAVAAALRRRLVRPPALLALVLLLGFYTAGHALANAKLRYSVPVMPLFMVLAADTLCALGSVALRRRADARSGVAQLAS
jgi:4-amino-4-deoxy-L-arabinose transferase-like glycosyltransferase